MSLTRRDLILCSILAALVLAVYWPVRYHQFVNFDDSDFVTGNGYVQSGLNLHSLWYALSAVVVKNWHPVTILSHELDCQLFGLDAGRQHLVSVAFHMANAALLFLVLRQMTAAFWRSAIVAALFALHPLRVESVAWIAERKDVLSGFFFFLTLLLYAKYVQESKAQTPGSKVAGPDDTLPASPVTRHPSPSPARFYLLTLLTFALGLMSKPMLVTLPFLLLLLDVWPLNRVELETKSLRFKTVWPLIREKWPFLALSAVLCLITMRSQPTYEVSLKDRVANAIVSYLGYLGKTLWPVRLAVLYPHPGLHYPVSDQAPPWQIYVTALLLLLFSLFCILQLSRRPWLAVGWFWYVGTMVPVIGLIQVGEQALADRYTYIPLIGPVVSLVWYVSELPLRPWGRAGLGAAAAAAVGACMLVSRHQLQYWQNSASLFEHAAAVTPDNPIAHNNLGYAFADNGQPELAAVQYRVAIAINPRHSQAHYNLAGYLRERDFLPQAVEHYLAVTRLTPEFYMSHLALAQVLPRVGRTREAALQMDDVLQLYPRTHPESPGSPVPRWTANALNDLAWFLASNERAENRDAEHAVRFAQRACELTQYKEAVMVGTLAAAYAEAGRFSEAIATAEKACALATESGNQQLLQRNQQLLELYRAGKPYHEPAPPQATVSP